MESIIILTVKLLCGSLFIHYISVVPDAVVIPLVKLIIFFKF